MHINGDTYYDKPDIENVIENLIKLKENVESTEDTRVIDEAVDILYDVIDAAE